MKLRYLRARNVLSFGGNGDKDIKLEFGPFNVIAGPNDSGKTNLFRALSLIEKAFDYGKPPLDEILFRGDSDRSLHLEVGVELDDTELELLATLIICSEMLSVLQPQDITQGINPRTKHAKLKNIREGTNNNILERLNGTKRERLKVMRGLDRDESAQKFVEADRLYYNFLRPHMALNGKTPAEMANIKLNLEQNRWLSLIRESVAKSCS